MEKTTKQPVEYCNETCTNCKRCEELEQRIKLYEEKLRLLTQRRFGHSSERSEVEGQEFLFNEAEAESDRKLPEPEMEAITYKRIKRKGKREEDLSSLPVERIEYELPEGERICPDCGGALHDMSVEIRKALKIIPMQVSVEEHVTHIYACRSCEKNSDSTPIVKAESPEPVIKGSVASPSAIAHIMTQKYVNAMPLYRQEKSFLYDDIVLSRQTMANWMIKCANDWLLPIYDKMKTALLKEEILHADETRVQVLKEPGRKATTESFEWLYRTSGARAAPIVIYEYQPTRSSSHPKRFLSGFSGYLHTDGYQGYHCIDGITVVGCFTHARRKFCDVIKALPKDHKRDSNAETGLAYCNKLFMLERKYAEDNLTYDEIYEQRLEKSKPVADEFLAWAKETREKVLPKSKIWDAVNYIIGQKEYLWNVFKDGRLEISNNRAENGVRPFCVGRRNWLFSNTPDGATASSIIYSIIETTKENGLKPFQYLKWLFEQLPNTTKPVEGFLPWSADVPDYCKMTVAEKEKFAFKKQKLYDELSKAV